MRKALNKLFAGSRIKIIIRLLIYSLVVGALLSILGFTALGFLQRIISWFSSLFQMGWGLIFALGGWVLSGAILVVPVWFVTRLFKNK